MRPRRDPAVAPPTAVRAATAGTGAPARRCAAPETFRRPRAYASCSRGSVARQPRPASIASCGDPAWSARTTRRDPGAWPSASNIPHPGDRRPAGRAGVDSRPCCPSGRAAPPTVSCRRRAPSVSPRQLRRSDRSRTTPSPGRARIPAGVPPAGARWRRRRNRFGSHSRSRPENRRFSIPVSPRHLSEWNGNIVQPAQRTLPTTYMRSAKKPSADSSRVAAISACSSGLPRPYFTRMTSCPGSSQSNFGVVPLMVFTTRRQSTMAFSWRASWSGGFRSRRACGIGTAGRCHTRAERSAAAR